MNPGILYAASAFVIWGLFPLYILQIARVAPLEVVAHRLIWSLAVVLLLLALQRRWAWLIDALRRPRVLATFALTSVLVACNWFVYVWAIQNQRVIDSSLGYFINPLVNVLLGYLVLHERPRRVQWVAIALAALGVVWLTVRAGQLPWIALWLASTFGLYGLIRKTASLGALEGLTLETMMLAPVGVALIGMLTWKGSGGLANHSASMLGWLLLAGPMTAIPLLLFAAGARRIPLATLGLLQYIGPSIQFLLGLWVFREPFDAGKMAGFALIWSALVVYSAEGWWMWRRAAAPA